jgi:integrase
VQEAIDLSRSARWVFPASRGEDHLTGFGLTQAIDRIFRGDPERPRVHDLRRTVGTRLSELGIARGIVDKVLNHKDRTVGGIYDRHSYDLEKRQALEAWERRLELVIATGRTVPCIGQST